VPAILVVPLATALVTVQTSRAEPAVDECKTKPDSSAPVGSHWYYRVNRADQRHCWYLGPEGAKVRSQAREGASRVSRPTGTAPAREDSPETTQAMPPPMEPAQRTTAESASVAAAKDLAASSSDLPKTPDLVVQEPATLSNRDTEDHQATEAHEEMPLIWPVLAEADRAGLADSAGEFCSLAGGSRRCSGTPTCWGDFQACSAACSIVSPRPTPGGAAHKAKEESLFGACERRSRSSGPQIGVADAARQSGFAAADVNRSG
jgi:hypothetical protein